MANQPNKMLPILPREPLASNVDISPRWRLYLEQLQRMLGNVNGLAWPVVDKSQASLFDLNTREHGQLQKVLGVKNGATVTDDPAMVLHVSKEDVSRWNGASGSNNSLFFWLFGS